MYVRREGKGGGGAEKILFNFEGSDLNVFLMSYKHWKRFTYS